MNVIFSFKQTADFYREVQEQINMIPFSRIPEMKQIKEIVEEEIVAVEIPYQANVEDEHEFVYLKGILEEFGIVSISGKWNEDGAQIEFNINEYRRLLKNIETFEDAVYLNSEDFTGREEEFVPETDEEGIDIVPNRRTFKRLKTSKIPTLAEARLIQVNVLDKQMKRNLK